MAKAKYRNLIGSWAFLGGVLLALIFGLFGQVEGLLVGALVLLGLIVGILNVTSEETHSFMMSGIALIIASAFGQTAVSAISVLSNVLAALLLVFVPATIVVAVKNVFGLARH